MTGSPNRLLGVVLGAAYLVTCALGFTATGGVEFFGTEGGMLLGTLAVNGAQNVLHLLIGAALLVAGLAGVRAARTVNVLVGAGCLLFGLAGLFLIGTAANVLALNVAGNVLHFGTAAVLLAAGLGADERANRSVR